MPYPADFDSAYSALYAALTTVRPHLRSLRTGETFIRLRAPKDDNAKAYNLTLVQKACVLRIHSPQTITQHVNCAEATYLCTCEIVRLYRSGTGLFDEETDAATKRALRDTHLVAQALTLPDCLALDPTGNATGIDGGALHLAGHSTDGPDHDPRNSVVRATDRFTISITLRSVDQGA